MVRYINILKKLLQRNKIVIFVIVLFLLYIFFYKSIKLSKLESFDLGGYIRSGEDNKQLIDNIVMTPNHQNINPEKVKGYNLLPETKQFSSLTLRQCQDECVRENCKFMNRPSNIDDLTPSECIISMGYNQRKGNKNNSYRTWENTNYDPPAPKSYMVILSQKVSNILGYWYNLYNGGSGMNDVNTFYDNFKSTFESNNVFDITACTILDLQDLVNANITECLYGWVKRNNEWVNAYPDGSTDTNCGDKGLNRVVMCTGDNYYNCKVSNIYVKFKSYKSKDELEDILKPKYNYKFVAVKNAGINTWTSMVTALSAPSNCTGFKCPTNYVKNGNKNNCPRDINNPLGMCRRDFCCKKAQQCSSYTCPSNMVKISDDKYCDKNPDGLCKLSDCCQLPDKTSCSEINCEQEYKDYIARGGGVSEFDWKGTYGEQLICERDVGKGGYINNKWNWGCCKATRNTWSHNTCDSRGVSSFCSYGEGNCRP